MMRRDTRFRVAGILLAAVAAVGLIAVLWWLLNRYIDPSGAGSARDVAAARNGVVDLLAKIVGGLAIAIGTSVTWWNYRASQRGQQETLRLTERGQITDRFTRAIDQLGATDSNGNKRLEVRLGGIHALERIARDSPDDHWAIVEVLTAYVRENAPWHPTPTRSESVSSPPLRAARRARTIMVAPSAFVRKNAPWWQKRPERATSPLDSIVEQPPLPTDIHAVLTVIGRRARWYGQGEEQPLDLRRTDLHGANLGGVHLEQAFLTGANLAGAHLAGAHLTGAYLDGACLDDARPFDANLDYSDLSGARLERASLDGSSLVDAQLNEADLLWATLREANLAGSNISNGNLKDANLRGADLTGARLQRAHLERADLGDANLERADLFKAHLSGADLIGASLKRAYFAGADLDGVRLLQANLTEADLTEVNLKRARVVAANLEGANLERADLDGADLNGASLVGAHLYGANLRHAVGLTSEQLAAALGDETTQLPDGLDCPPHWRDAAPLRGARARTPRIEDILSDIAIFSPGQPAWWKFWKR